MNAICRGAILSRIVIIAITSLLFHTQVFAQVDPPGRVARLSYSYGDIRFLESGTDKWSAIETNRPLTTNDSIWVPIRGKAELHIGSTAIRVNEKTELGFSRLDDDNAQLRLNRGDVILTIPNLSRNQNFEVDTPNIAFSIQEAGVYRIYVDDRATTVNIKRGVGVVYGEKDSVTVLAGEQGYFTGNNLGAISINNIPSDDAFDRWAEDRNRAEESSISAQYVSREVIGYQQLDQYGTWETHTEYGAIWIPRNTSVDWAPYRTGHWAWVSPWGWTWIDSAPWGFAPYHYGRWAHIDSRWAWVPGRREVDIRPIYSPALVAFVGGSRGNVSWNIGIGTTQRPAMGWFPLAPGEHYVPQYRTSDRYIVNINYNSVPADRNRREYWEHAHDYRNEHINHAVSAAPIADFSHGRQISSVVRPVNTKDLESAKIIQNINISPQKDPIGRRDENRAPRPNDGSNWNRPDILGNQTNFPGQRRANNEAPNANAPLNIASPNTNYPAQSSDTSEFKRRDELRRSPQQASPTQPETLSIRGRRPVEEVPSRKFEQANNPQDGEAARRFGNGRTINQQNNVIFNSATSSQTPVPNAPMPNSSRQDPERAISRIAPVTPYETNNRPAFGAANENARPVPPPQNVAPFERRREISNEDSNQNRQQRTVPPPFISREMNRPVPAQESSPQIQRVERPAELKREAPQKVEKEREREKEESRDSRRQQR